MVRASSCACLWVQRMRRYLVVDDNEAFAENLSEILSDTGAQVDIALGGEAAIELVEKNRYDLVISDMRMPIMGGAELVHRIRRLEPGLPSIVLTAYINDDDLQTARDEGVLAVLPKPAPMRRLLELCAAARRDGLVAVIHDEAAMVESVTEALRQRGFATASVLLPADAVRLHHLRPFAALIDLRSESAKVAVSATAQAMPGLPMLVVGDPEPGTAPGASVILFRKPVAVTEIVTAVEELYGSCDG
jgi:CheY-like chemotaxis protein